MQAADGIPAAFSCFKSSTESSNSMAWWHKSRLTVMNLRIRSSDGRASTQAEAGYFPAAFSQQQFEVREKFRACFSRCQRFRLQP